MDYNKTINLPKTDFPMRAGLPAREPEMLERWKKIDVYNELLKKNEGKPRFALHDGPPFSNGGLHMGHALNKSIKDFITRSYAMRGYYTPYIPGWDNHGMPIESAIIKEQKLNRKQMSVAEFRTACHNYAQKYIDIQMAGFQRMGVIGDWEHPYKTMDPGFEAEEVKIFGAMYKKGYIYKGLKPVYWCPKDETALAEAEIEYQDDPCTTVYVKFPMHDDQGKLGQFDHSKLFFVIWTTTIWTLPGNLAIAVHPRESYVLVKAENGEMYILAEALTGSRHLVEAMRAYAHEFINKLHTILGLIQLDRVEQAEQYILDVSEVHHQSVSRVMNQIEDTAVAALLVGKASRAAELGIQLQVDPRSSLSGEEHMLPSGVMVTILGNLIENATESLNHSTRKQKEIHVSILENPDGLLLCVEDTGPGILPELLPYIFEDLTDLYHGQIRVESEPKSGTSFFLSFPAHSTPSPQGGAPGSP